MTGLELFYWYGLAVAIGVWLANEKEPQSFWRDLIDSLMLALWPLTVSIVAFRRMRR